MNAHDRALTELRLRRRCLLTRADWAENKIHVGGWVVPPGFEAFDVGRGARIAHLHSGQKRPALADIFKSPDYEDGGFSMTVELVDVDPSEPWANYVVLKPCYADGSDEIDLANTWLVPRAPGRFILPEAERINRVTGQDSSSIYLFGGATHAFRLATALERATGRSVSSFNSIADWGVGSGRLLQHFLRQAPGRVIGVDVDGDNVAWCQREFPGTRFHTVPWQPPTDLADGAFDLIFAFSVFSHIKMDRQEAWIAELSRLLRPNGVAVVTTLGRVSSTSRRPSPEFFDRLASHGYVEWANSGQLKGIQPTESDYINICLTQECAADVYGRHLRVAGYYPGLGPQDGWVLVKDK